MAISTEKAFVARNSPLATVPLLLGAILFVLAGLWIAGLFGPAFGAGVAWIGWVGVAFFGLCALVLLPRLFDRSELIRVDSTGITWRRFSDDVIQWGDIRAMSVVQVQKTRFVSIDLRDPSRYRRNKGVVALLEGANRAGGFGDVAIATTGTDRNFDALMAAIDHHGRG